MFYGFKELGKETKSYPVFRETLLKNDQCVLSVDGSKGELSLQSQLISRHVNMILDLKDEAASKIGM